MVAALDELKTLARAAANNFLANKGDRVFRDGIGFCQGSSSLCVALTASPTSQSSFRAGVPMSPTTTGADMDAHMQYQRGRFIGNAGFLVCR